jgi:hypothetical protein
MTHNHSDGADELIAQAARDYNAPGAVPRDEIWNRIVEARRSALPVEPIASPLRRTRYWVWPSIGVAAAGLVAIGVAIGRNVERTRVPAPLAAAPRDSARTAPDLPATGLPTGAAPELVANAPASDSASAGARPAARGSLVGDRTNSDNIAYRLAVVNHVVGSEAMITAFRASARRGEVDPQLAKWSHDLLGETRLLESSASSDDVTMKRLLEDLELVLVQIVQYTNHGTHSPDDLDLIDRSIRRRSVMSNIRNVSAGQLPSGT